MKHPKFDTTPAVSKRMSHVHLKRGKAETALAKALWHRGYRYRLNDKRLPGSPDIALTKYKVAIFVDGEFWHGYDWANKKLALKSNQEYWIEKIEENISRDTRDRQRLAAQDWTVLRFWEKEVKRDLEGCIQVVESTILDLLTRQYDGDIGAELSEPFPTS